MTNKNKVAVEFVMDLAIGDYLAVLGDHQDEEFDAFVRGACAVCNVFKIDVRKLDVDHLIANASVADDPNKDVYCLMDHLVGIYLGIVVDNNESTEDEVDRVDVDTMIRGIRVICAEFGINVDDVDTCGLIEE